MNDSNSALWKLEGMAEEFSTVMVVCSGSENTGNRKRPDSKTESPSMVCCTIEALNSAVEVFLRSGVTLTSKCDVSSKNSVPPRTRILPSVR